MKLILLLGLAALILQAQGQDLTKQTSDLIDSLTKNYDQKLRPNYGTSTPVHVNISAYIIDIHPDASEGFKVKFDFYFRQLWNDPRLKYSPVAGAEHLVFGKRFSKDIWLPDTFISNAEKTEVQQSISGRDSAFIRVTPNGDVFYSTRILATVQCSNDLGLFPVDQQKCSLEFESYGYSESDIEYSCANKLGFSISDNLSLDQLKLIHHKASLKQEHLSTGTYSRLIFDIYFARSACHYISHHFLPAAILVACSWIVFWLHPASKLVKLLLSSVLTLIMMQFIATSDLPESSHFKAIDIYLFASFGFILLALIESCAVAHYQAKKQQRDLEHQDQKQPFFSGLDCGSRIDFWSRRLFPGAFVAFNLVYVIGLMIAAHAQSKVAV